MDLLQFLRSRGVGEDYLRKLVDDKIDSHALLAMDEENRVRYIPSYGDRVSAIAFCRAQIDATCNSVSQECTGGQLLQRLRQKQKQSHIKFGNRNAQKQKRRVELGWMDFNKDSKEFKQVRSQRGGGTRHLCVEKDCTLAELLDIGKDLFCLDKTSISNSGSYDIELRVACLNVDIDLNMTIHDCYERSKVKILRVYLYTKYLPGECSQPSPSQQDVTVKDDEADFDLPVITFSRGHKGRSRSLSTQAHQILSATPSATITPVVTFSSTVATDTLVTSSPGVAEIQNLYRRHRQSSDSSNQVKTATCTAISNTVATDTGTPNPVSATLSATITPVVTFSSTVATDTLVTSSPGVAEIQNEFLPTGTPTVLFRSDSTMVPSSEEMAIDDEDDDMFQEALRRSLEPEPTLTGLLGMWIEQTLHSKEHQSIIVQRGNVLKSTLRTVLRLTFDWNAPVKVVYAGEIGDDLGGPKREFFRELLTDIVDDILMGPDENKVFKHDIQKVTNKNYEIAGKLTAYSLLNGGPGLPLLNKDVYSLMTGGELSTTQDMDISKCVFDKDTLSHLQLLKEASTEEEMQTCVEKESDWLLEQGLVPFGIKLEQKDEVVRTLLQHILHYRVHSEICQFTNGMDQIGELYQTVLKAPGVMQPLFVNQGKLQSFESFRALYKVNYSPVGSNMRKGENDTIYCFEAFLMDCEGQTSGVTLEDVLAFWTGATTVPPMGFPKDLEIDFISSQTHYLPVAHTCGMSLDLNRGMTDPDKFQADMVKAITWTGGFYLC